MKANRERDNDVGPLFFSDINMVNVKNALIVSEYYRKILPPDSEKPQPITRLTPYFHSIAIKNLIATGSMSAGAIAGLPEAPITGVTLNNVRISARTGLTVGFAQVSGREVNVQAEDGPSIIKGDGAVVSLR